MAVRLDSFQTNPIPPEIFSERRKRTGKSRAVGDRGAGGDDAAKLQSKRPPPSTALVGKSDRLVDDAARDFLSRWRENKNRQTRRPRGKVGPERGHTGIALVRIVEYHEGLDSRPPEIAARQSGRVHPRRNLPAFFSRHRHLWYNRFMSGSFLYPIALDVRGRRCVVVGGGPVGRRKADALRDVGADVVILSLETTGPFAPEQLDGAFLAVAATDDPAVNATVAGAARERGVLLNLAAPGGDAESGDFAAMASVRRGSLVIGVTTGGAGPALSARLRRRLQEEYGPEWTMFVALLAEARIEAKVRFPDPTERADRLRALAEREEILEKLRAGDLDGALEEAARCLE